MLVRSIQKEPLALAEVVERILAAVEVELEDRGIALRIDIPADLPPVHADRQRIEQVLLNLLANAMRYTPAGGAISIAAYAEKDRLQVSVCDNGPGLSEEDLGHAFDRFYRADVARTRENAPTGGACFHFTLPSAASLPETMS